MPMGVRRREKVERTTNKAVQLEDSFREKRMAERCLESRV